MVARNMSPGSRWIVLVAVAILAPIFSARSAAAAAAARAHAVSVEGVIDLHCHSGPDAVPRSVNDLELVRQARAAGLRAVVIKNHFTMTADRAQLAMEEVPGMEVFGGIVLNASVGGLNAEAVRRMIAMRGNRGKIVWLPTLDAANQVDFAKESRPFVAVVRAGKPVPELQEIFALIARHELVLATGHSSADESIVLLTAAREAGVKKMLVTHGLAEAIRGTPEKLRTLADLGALIECTWLTHVPGQGGAINVGRVVPVEEGVRIMRAIGFERVVISSDFGQQHNLPPPEGMRAFISALLANKVSPAEIDFIARRNPARLLGLE
jgi:hypothetical protein